MRKRKEEVMYDDHMTEKQFVRRMEAQAAIEEQQQQTSKRRDSSAGGEGGIASNKKIKFVVGAAKSEDFFHHNEISNYYLIYTYSKPFLPSHYATLERVLQHVSNLLSEDGTRSASALFLSKPDKKLYPDYYNFIESPISLKEIVANIKKNSYKSFIEIEYDFAVMAMNARTFNSDQSLVYHDAELIRKNFYDWCCRYDVIDKTIKADITAGM